MSEAAIQLGTAPQAAREQMIQQQLRTWDVFDESVLQVFARLDRAAFVPAAYRSLAYADLAIPLGDDEHMLAPKLAGRMLQAVKPGPNERALELGTGSGFLTAALGLMACSVRSVERRADQAAHACTSLKESGLRNTEVVVGDAYDPAILGDLLYDVIVLGGSLPRREPRFEAKLAIGGRLFAVIGQGSIMSATLILRTGEAAWRETSLFETVLKPMHGASAPSAFRF